MTTQHYLDNAATTRVSDSVLQAMLPFFQSHYGNPSSLHNLGVDASNALKKARRNIANALCVESRELVFTSGGTESNNLALKGAARALKRRGQHIICSSIEHPSVLECCDDLAKEGFTITKVVPNQNGQIQPEQILNALQEDTILISIMQVQNETGAINPVEAIATAVKQKQTKIIIHVDGVQALGKLPTPCAAVDCYSFSGHKIHGPKGIGGLIVRNSARLLSPISGGGQENGLRSGTENLPAIVGLAKAVQEACKKRDQQYALWQQLKTTLSEGCTLLGGHINSPKCSSPSLLNASFPGHPAEVLLHLLESHRVYVSNGSACASKKNTESHVLKALGLSPDLQKSALRFSMGWNTTIHDIEACLAALKAALEELGPVKTSHPRHGQKNRSRKISQPGHRGPKTPHSAV
jgi:cysteine desulfurase